MHVSGDVLPEYLMEKVREGSPGLLAINATKKNPVVGYNDRQKYRQTMEYEFQILVVRGDSLGRQSLKNFFGCIFPNSRGPEFSVVRYMEIPLTHFPGLDELKIKDECVRNLVDSRTRVSSA